MNRTRWERNGATPNQGRRDLPHVDEIARSPQDYEAGEDHEVKVLNDQQLPN